MCRIHWQDIREELVINAIEATAYTNSACVADFLRESMLASWTSKRSLLMEALRGKTGGDGSPGSKNVNSNYATAMGKVCLLHYAFSLTSRIGLSLIFSFFLGGGGGGGGGGRRKRERGG